MAKYKSYLHVERLSNPDCEGLLQNDQVFVTAKVDGTNACVWYDPDTNEIITVVNVKYDILLKYSVFSLVNGVSLLQIFSNNRSTCFRMK